MFVRCDKVDRGGRNGLLLCNRNVEYLFSHPMVIPIHHYSHISDRLSLADINQWSCQGACPKIIVEQLWTIVSLLITISVVPTMYLYQSFGGVFCSIFLNGAKCLVERLPSETLWGEENGCSKKKISVETATIFLPALLKCQLLTNFMLISKTKLVKPVRAHLGFNLEATEHEQRVRERVSKHEKTSPL